MAEEKMVRSKGVVTKFNDHKGYGFIQPDEGGEDLFVHQTAIKSDGYRTLREGQVVEFTIILDGDKTKATDVTAPGGGPLENTNSRRGGGYGYGDRRNDGDGYGYRRNDGDGYGYRRNDGDGYGYRRNDGDGYGYRSGGGGGGNSGVCYTCGGIGHMARDCPSGGRGGGGGGGGGACYSCGEIGHLARDCAIGGGGGGGGVYYSRGGGGGGGGGGVYYSRGGGGGGGAGYGRFGGGGGVGVGGGKCFNCGEAGHFARECKEGPRE